MTKKRKSILVALLIIYTIAIIYFMFFGFGRQHRIETSFTEYRYSITPTSIPLWLPKKLSFLWLFSLGNLIAFVPFGILIPMIFDIKYPKFIFTFLLLILLSEVLQMVTYRGSFDIEDIIVNSIGATIGFISYKVSNKFKSESSKRVSTLISIFVLSFAMIIFAEIFNKFI